MGKIIKSTIRKLAAIAGYQVRRMDDTNANYIAFENLAEFCESQLSLYLGMELPANDKRRRLVAKLQGTPPVEAYYILDAINKCRNLAGDVCEFGCAEGETTALIANEIIDTDQNLHVFDSFEGLSKPSEKDQLIDDVLQLGSMSEYAGKMSFPEASVQKRLALVGFPVSRTHVHKGFIDDVLQRNTALPQKVSFAYVDFDFYEPILSALKYLDGVTDPGAIIVVDDYGFFSSGAQTAVDEWVASANQQQVRYKIRIPPSHHGKFAVLEKLK